MSKTYYTDKDGILISYFEEEKLEFLQWIKLIKYIRILNNA